MHICSDGCRVTPHASCSRSANANIAAITIFNDRQWRKARLTFLRYNPLCIACQDEGIVKGAQVVDHIQRHEGQRPLFWDSNNWQALCKSCHDRNTAFEVGFVKV